jgi:DNA polymerase elongation subunit (family B)
MAYISKLKVNLGEMIVDIENKGTYLNVSTFSEEGDLVYVHVPVPENERFVWEKCSPSDRNRDTDWKCWDGSPVKRTKSQRYDKYRMIQILENADPELTKPLWDFQTPKKYFVDIEVEMTDEMGDSLDTASAKNRILSIGIATDKCKSIVLGLDPLSPEEQADIWKKTNDYLGPMGDEWSFKYKQFDSEYDMLYTFFKDIASKMPLITGWNWFGYDWPYLVNRAKRLGIDPKIISPSQWLIGQNNLPMHLLMVDYLEIYKKWDRVIKIKESNRLDYVAEKSTGLKKIHYDGSLRDLYQSDFPKFILYNVIDCALVHYIDQKLKTMLTYFKIANLNGVEISRALSPVWSTEVMMLRKFLERGQVFVPERKEESHVKFIGGYVKEPIKGLHEWVACYDFASLYPNTIVQWGISPEVYKGKNLQTAKDSWVRTSSGAMFGGDDESPILKTIIKDLYAKRRATKDRMLKLQIEIDQLEKQLKKLT